MSPRQHRSRRPIIDSGQFTWRQLQITPCCVSAIRHLRRGGSKTEPDPNRPVAYFAAVVRGEIAEHPLSSLETNLIVTEILDAARESARTHQSIELPEKLAE